MLILSIANLSAVHIGNSYFGDNQLMKVVDTLTRIIFIYCKSQHQCPQIGGSWYLRYHDVVGLTFATVRFVALLKTNRKLPSDNMNIYFH